MCSFQTIKKIIRNTKDLSEYELLLSVEVKFIPDSSGKMDVIPISLAGVQRKYYNFGEIDLRLSI